MPYFAESETIFCITFMYVSLYFPLVGSSPGHMNPSRTTLRPSDFKSCMSCSENVPSENPSVSGCQGYDFTTTLVPWKNTSRPKLSISFCLSGFTEIGRRFAAEFKAKKPRTINVVSIVIKVVNLFTATRYWEISHEIMVSFYINCVTECHGLRPFFKSITRSRNKLTRRNEGNKNGFGKWNYVLLQT